MGDQFGTLPAPESVPALAYSATTSTLEESMRRYPLYATLLASLLVAFPSLPAQATDYATVNPTITTDVSGFRGSVQWVTELPGPNLLKGIKWAEHSDKPCVLALVIGQMWQPSIRYDAPAAWERCGGNQSSAVLLIDNSMRMAQFTDTYEYVSGISVCTNNADNHRLKGISLEGSIVRYFPAGNGITEHFSVHALSATNTRSARQPSNCNRWHNAVRCPSEQVAVGLAINYEDDAMVGLALRCRAIGRR